MRRFRFPPRTRHNARPASDVSPRRQQSRAYNHVALAIAGLAIYLGTLWFGTEVIGDTATRSTIMAGIILLIAAVGYVATHQPAREDEETGREA